MDSYSKIQTESKGDVVYLMDEIKRAAAVALDGQAALVDKVTTARTTKSGSVVDPESVKRETLHRTNKVASPYVVDRRDV